VFLQWEQLTPAHQDHFSLDAVDVLVRLVPVSLEYISWAGRSDDGFVSLVGDEEVTGDDEVIRMGVLFAWRKRVSLENGSKAGRLEST
jgi:hypothetical protein